jgi:hypothetical protein
LGADAGRVAVSGEVQIRPAGVADADGLADLWVEIGEHLVLLDYEAFQVPAADGSWGVLRRAT